MRDFEAGTITGGRCSSIRNPASVSAAGATFGPRSAQPNKKMLRGAAIPGASRLWVRNRHHLRGQPSYTVSIMGSKTEGSPETYFGDAFEHAVTLDGRVDGVDALGCEGMIQR
jgi:hypothetical protein